MRDGKGFLLVYNIISRPTFDEVSVLYEKILRTKDATKVPVVLVGNKVRSARAIAIANEPCLCSAI